LKQHVERVLQMAQIDKEDIVLKKEVVDIHVIIRDVVKSFMITSSNAALNITMEFAASNAQLTCDRLHVVNVFSNLIDNAIKYCKTQPAIVIRTANVKAGLLVEVSDNGIGVSHDNLRRIFQKFYRVPTGNIHDVKGFGLGLSYVKTILEAHKGTVTVASIVEKGSTFKILFPH